MVPWPIFIYVCMYLSGCGGLHWLMIFSLTLVSRGYPVAAGHSRLSAAAPLVVDHRLSSIQASVIMTHCPSCLKARGIFPDQESNPCLLQMDSLPLSYQGSPAGPILNFSGPIQLFLYYQPNKSIEHVANHISVTPGLYEMPCVLLDRSLHGGLRSISPLSSPLLHCVQLQLI